VKDEEKENVKEKKKYVLSSLLRQTQENWDSVIVL